MTASHGRLPAAKLWRLADIARRSAGMVARHHAERLLAYADECEAVLAQLALVPVAGAAAAGRRGKP